MADKATMITKGKEKYISSIRGLGGASAYYSCGSKGGMDVAVCMKGLKEALSESDWADRWEANPISIDTCVLRIFKPCGKSGIIDMFIPFIDPLRVYEWYKGFFKGRANFVI